jgi:hypothetical protein
MGNESKMITPSEGNSPTIICLKSKRLVKSVQNFTSLRRSDNKSACLRPGINLPKRNAFKRQTFQVNLRYLVNSFNDCEDINQIETPSESLACNDNSLAEKVDLAYQKYIKNEEDTSEVTNSRGFSFTPSSRNGSNRKCRDVARMNVGCENRNVWRTRRIF